MPKKRFFEYFHSTGEQDPSLYAMNENRITNAMQNLYRNTDFYTHIGPHLQDAIHTHTEVTDIEAEALTNDILEAIETHLHPGTHNDQ